MARMEAQLDAIQDEWEKAIAAGERTASKGWSDIVKSLTSEHRNIQTTLGISRSARDKTRTREDLADYVQEVIRKSSAFVDEHAVQIRCPDTPWRFEFQCPLCQEDVKLP